jgi:hypothetical protein
MAKIARTGTDEAVLVAMRYVFLITRVRITELTICLSSDGIVIEIIIKDATDR